MPSLAIVSAVNSEDVFRQNLGASPLVLAGVPVSRQAGYATAGQALNAGLDEVDADVIACIHQDVYLPNNWETRVFRAIELLETAGQQWGVLGIWGIDAGGKFHGRVWCSGADKEHAGGAFATRAAENGELAVHPPTPIVSMDEVVIVLNGRAGLRFDDALPGFHLYGTDICLRAAEAGRGAFAIDAPVIHNSRPNPQVFDRHYFAAYRSMQRRWRDRLPLQTCVVPVTRTGWPLARAWLRREVRRRTGNGPAGARRDRPEELARQLNYE